MNNKQNDWNTTNVQLIIDNDQKEITKLYNKINGWLMFITNQNEELSNDIFLKIISRFDKYEPAKSKLHNFIFTIGKNELCSFLRLKNNKNVEIEYMDITHSINNQCEIEYNEEFEDEYNKHMELIDQKLFFEEKKFMLEYTNMSRRKTKKEKDIFEFLKNKIKNG